MPESGIPIASSAGANVITPDDGTGATWITASSEVGGFLTDDRTGPWVCDPDESRIVPTG